MEEEIKEIIEEIKYNENAKKGLQFIFETMEDMNNENEKLSKKLSEKEKIITKLSDEIDNLVINLREQKNKSIFKIIYEKIKNEKGMRL